MPAAVRPRTASRPADETAGAPPGLISNAQVPPNEPPAEPGMVDDYELEAQIDEILNHEDKDTVQIEIHRRDRITKRYGYLESLTFEEWTREDGKRYIAETYGAGEYRGRIRRQGGIMGRTFNFTVDGAVKVKTAATESAEVAALRKELAELKQQHNREGAGQSTVMDLMRESSERMIAMQREAQAQQMQLFTALITRPVPPGPSDAMMQLLLTKALTPPPAVDLDKILSAVGKIAAMGQGGRVEDKEDDGSAGLFGLITKALPLVAGLLQAAQTKQPDAAPAGPALNSPAHGPRPMTNVTPSADPAAPVQAANPDAAPAADPIPAKLKNSLGQSLALICGAAERGDDPDAVAKQISAGLEDADFAELCTLLERSDWMAVLIDAHEPVQRFTLWFNKLRDALLSELEPEGADTGT